MISRLLSITLVASRILSQFLYTRYVIPLWSWCWCSFCFPPHFLKFFKLVKLFCRFLWWYQFFAFFARTFFAIFFHFFRCFLKLTIFASQGFRSPWAKPLASEVASLPDVLVSNNLSIYWNGFYVNVPLYFARLSSFCLLMCVSTLVRTLIFSLVSFLKCFKGNRKFHIL